MWNCTHFLIEFISSVFLTGNRYKYIPFGRQNWISVAKDNNWKRKKRIENYSRRKVIMKNINFQIVVVIVGVLQAFVINYVSAVITRNICNSVTSNVVLLYSLYCFIPWSSGSSLWFISMSTCHSKKKNRYYSVSVGSFVCATSFHRNQSSRADLIKTFKIISFVPLTRL